MAKTLLIIPMVLVPSIKFVVYVSYSIVLYEYRLIDFIMFSFIS